MRIPLILSLCCLFYSCNYTSPEQHIIGAWKVDSTYTFYNGFGFTDKESDQDWAILLYEAEGTVKEVKYATFRQHHYEFVGRDSLVFMDKEGNITSSFKILKLDKQHLNLYKSKLPIFSGASQKRYEIRYFSRTNSPSNLSEYQIQEPMNQIAR